MSRVQIRDIETGELIVRDMTPEEQAAFDAEQAANATIEQARQEYLTTLASALPTEEEAATDTAQLATALDQMKTYLSAAGSTRTDAQRIAFERNVGRVLRHLVRRIG